MSWEGVDHALNRVCGEADDISFRLASLDRHVGYRLLRDADLDGGTRHRWEGAQAHVHRLWKVYDAFRAVVDRALGIRENGGGDPLPDLTFLLTDESVVLPPAERSPHEHGLPGPDTERITPAEAVARMTADYEAVTEVVSAVETAWDTLHPRLGELETMWQEIGTLSDMVELDPEEHEGLREQLVREGETVRRDPLRLVTDTRVDTSSLDRLRDLLDRSRGELRDALRMRDSYTENIQRLVSAVDDVEQAVVRARDLRTRVVAKISSPSAADVPDPVPGLRAAVVEMDALRAQGDWRALGARLGRLQRSIHQAGDDARERERSLAGLLRRRAELRGRLDAFRARAVRLGLAEHTRLGELHRQAHWELWNAPCDLRAATVALSAYQRTIQELSGTGHPGNRTTPGNGASDGETDGGVSR
ncbi:hypothetical protein ACWFMI_06535 [Nocardiopsis terrae]